MFKIVPNFNRFALSPTVSEISPIFDFFFKKIKFDFVLIFEIFKIFEMTKKNAVNIDIRWDQLNSVRLAQSLTVADIC